MSEAERTEERAERDEATIYTPDEARGRAPGRSRLSGRRILVVGAGTQPSDDPEAPEGNGRAIAMLCAREGAQVACADKSEPSAQETVQRIAKEGGRAQPFTADVADPSACEQLVQASHRTLGGLDGVVVNVGTGLGRGLAGTDVNAWDSTFAVNLRAHFLIARAAMPLFTSGASLVFIGSVAGIRPGSGLPSYDSSKAGLLGLCRHVAFEGSARGVRANMVVPGLIDTPLGRVATRRRPSRGRTAVPLGRQGTAWEVAYATVFLLGGESSYITAQSLVIDGGLSGLR
jgi:NAD(P)-dependent dehydrogenase (short-subunit alcohol dehydrogenase family)